MDGTKKVDGEILRAILIWSRDEYLAEQWWLGYGNSGKGK